MAYVPAGPFVMGMEVDPAHEVYASRRQVVDLPTFCIETLEVTNEEYRRCEEQGRCRAPRLGYGPDEHPVVGVNWSQAAAYCESVGRRLPTASEWEKTARGGCEIVEPPTCGPEDERRYPWGVDEPTCERANYRGCTRDGTDAADGRTAGASPYGVLQMLGNAAEWVDGLEGYDRIAGFDRGDDAAHDSVERASYGCSWFCDADDLEISSRWSNQPRSDDRFQGFRCATTVEPLRSVEIEWASDRRARAVQQPGSGLWWLRCNGTPALDPYCGEATWAEAGAICPPGWRLPERFELVALLGGVGGCSPEVLASDRAGTCGTCEANATCRAVLGPSSPPVAWTSTKAGEGRAWTVSIADGAVGPEPTSRSHAVPCVREGPPATADDARDGEPEDLLYWGRQLSLRAWTNLMDSDCDVETFGLWTPIEVRILRHVPLVLRGQAVESADLRVFFEHEASGPASPDGARAAFGGRANLHGQLRQRERTTPGPDAGSVRSRAVVHDAVRLLGVARLGLSGRTA